MEIIKTDISDKLLDLNSEKPAYYIEIVFKEDIENFDFLFFKNYYTTFITVRQFDASKPDDSNWVPILDKYRLMESCDYDFDAEKIHLIDRKFVAIFNNSL
jgi:hypothetical protein